MHDPQLDNQVDLNTIYRKDENGNIIDEQPWEPGTKVIDTVREEGVIDMQQVVDSVPLLRRISAAMEELTTEFSKFITDQQTYFMALAKVLVKYELTAQDVKDYTYEAYLEYMVSIRKDEPVERKNPFLEFRKGVKQWDDTMKEWQALAERDARTAKREQLEAQQRLWIKNAIENPDQVKGQVMPNRADRRRAAKKNRNKH